MRLNVPLGLFHWKYIYKQINIIPISARHSLRGRENEFEEFETKTIIISTCEYTRNEQDTLDRYEILPKIISNKLWRHEFTNCELEVPPFWSMSMDDCLSLAQLYFDKNTNAYSTTSMRPFECRILDEKSYHTKTNQTNASSNDKLNYEIRFEVHIKTLRLKHQNDDHDLIYNLKLETTVFISSWNCITLKNYLKHYTPTTVNRHIQTLHF